jgi:uncharacterized radical SAM superfamily protein
MAQLSPETVWNTTARNLYSLLEAGTLVRKPLKANFYTPSFMHYRTSHYCSKPNQFPTISVTGKDCALNCKHCGGKLLKTMHPAETPEALFTLSSQLKQAGASGCLVSGGCLPDGSVPLKQFIPVLGRIKRELGLTVLVHTGIIDAATAEALKTAGVDAALIDIIGSNETIKKVYNLNATVEDYASSLKALSRASLNFVPHVIVGLHGGKLQGELHALQLISRYKPSALVIIAFMPIRGAVMARVKPPQPIDIARIAATARLMFPEAPLALGCMRPKGKHRAETDVLCLKAGVDAVAFPSEEAIAYAERQGYALSFSSCCCSQVYADKRVA